MNGIASLSALTADIPETVRTREEILDAADAIAGWYPKENLEWLYGLAILWNNKSPKFLEVGTWLGRSAYVLAAIAKKSGGVLTCVDTWAGLIGKPNDPRYKHEYDVLERARANLAPVVDVINFCQGDSRNVLKQFSHESFDLVHIDGDHGAPIVNLDVHMGWKLTKRFGVLCGDDFEEPDVCQAVVHGLPRYQRFTVYDGRSWYTVKTFNG